MYICEDDKKSKTSHVVVAAVAIDVAVVFVFAVFCSISLKRQLPCSDGKLANVSLLDIGMYPCLCFCNC